MPLLTSLLPLVLLPLLLLLPASTALVAVPLLLLLMPRPPPRPLPATEEEALGTEPKACECTKPCSSVERSCSICFSRLDNPLSNAELLPVEEACACA